MTTSEQDNALDMLQRFDTGLRKAILAEFPCAFEQYICIAVPGTVIDIRDGGSYLPAATGINADHRNEIQCNEARLVDSMVPLDNIMLGSIGKSVTRSYFTSLEMLVPRRADIGTSKPSVQRNTEADTPEQRYNLAMEYLRKDSPRTTSNNLDVRANKDTLVAKGVPRSTIEAYMEKQLAWTTARQKWDAARNDANAARDSIQGMDAAAFSSRQKALKAAQGELHAREMDWIVNGEKLRVESAFALGDRDRTMARVERAKQATRDAMLSSIDGTEWANVQLEPQTWARLCQKKAPVNASGAVGNDHDDTADFWTQIKFTVNAKADKQSSDKSSKASNLSIETRSLFWSIKVEHPSSESSQKFSNFMASCNINASFSAMVVNIKRPWLHHDLFQDYDIDLPRDVWLSPGARVIKHWIETGNDNYGGKLRTNYGKFPAYPTAFIVAASALFVFKNGKISAQEALDLMQRDNSASFSVGCWRWAGGESGSSEGRSVNSSQSMEVKDGALHVSFQAPQIIGWVCDILPELPRRGNP